jgi:hypothetical protein
MTPKASSWRVQAWRRQDIDGALRARHSRWRVGWLAASRKFGTTADLSGLLRIVGRDSAEVMWDGVSGYLV